jgi:hypothetical protein
VWILLSVKRDGAGVVEDFEDRGFMRGMGLLREKWVGEIGVYMGGVAESRVGLSVETEELWIWWEV